MKSMLAALGMAVIAATAQAGEKKMSGVQQQVQVDAGQGKVVVKLTVINGSAKAVYVPKPVFEDDELFGRAFDIVNLDTGKAVDYIGPMVKRAPLGKDDYLPVKAGARHVNSIDITRSYDFKPGTHNYQLSFAGNYLGELAKLEAATMVTVAPVKFTFTAK